MSDISDDEAIEKPKRVMSDKQKEALKKGRELAKLNREAQKKQTEKLVEKQVEKPVEQEVKPEKKTRKKKELVVEIPEVKNEVIEVQGKRVSRKAKEVREPSPPRPPTPEEPVKKTRTPRQKKTEQPSQQPVIAQPKPQKALKPTLQFV